MLSILGIMSLFFIQKYISFQKPQKMGVSLKLIWVSACCLTSGLLGYINNAGSSLPSPLPQSAKYYRVRM
jgi:hypothetical protein